jgi:hypothetical protein
MCDPFRVGFYLGPVTVGVVHGYHMLPFQGADGFSDSLYFAGENSSVLLAV